MLIVFQMSDASCVEASTSPGPARGASLSARATRLSTGTRSVASHCSAATFTLNLAMYRPSPGKQEDHIATNIYTNRTDDSSLRAIHLRISFVDRRVSRK